FAIPIARFGILLDDLTISRLVSQVGAGHAREMLLTGNTMGGAQAEKIGLLNAVVPHNDLVIHVDEIARQLAANAAPAIALLKESINRIALGRALDAEVNDEQVVSSYLSSEFRDRLSKRR
ncbi:MAG TPA: enoyl-CoA hydratase-related protein, partial [Chroococcales cyanobacterium]